MPATVTRRIANAWQDPPWSDCGDLHSADLGRVFAWPVADGALALTFDRDGRRHALTLFDAAQLGSDIVIYGRRFSVVLDAVGG
jgi:hypothetical protein